MSSSQWIPFQWPATWRDADKLKLLESTPINCLLFDKDAPAELRSAAEANKLNCPANVDWRSWKEIDWKSPGDPVAISDGLWPALAMKASGGDNAQSGPTGAPWLDANGWLLQLLRGRARNKTLWLRSDPPADVAQLTPQSYTLALSEAYVYGARRPAWLAEPHATALAAGSTAAVNGWKSMMESIRWQETRRAWAEWPTFARLLVVSDYAGENEYNAGEVLNLSARQNLAFHPVETAQFQPQLLQGRRAVLYVDPQPFPAPMAAALQKFVEAGGLLVCMKPPAAALTGVRLSKETHARFDLFDVGKGRVAVSKAEWEDQYILAQDTHLMMSRRYDAVRLFNAGSLTYFHTASPDGKRWLIHLLNYTGRGAAHQVSLQTWQKVKSATFHSLESAQPQALPVQRETGQPEVYLPRFSVYSAVELELTPHA